MTTPRTHLRRAALAAALVAAFAGVAGAGAAEPIPVVVGEPWIVYQRVAGDIRLRLVRPDGTDDHEAVPDVPGDQVHPDWSPDGERLAFVVDGRTITIAKADGSDAQAVVGCEDPCVLVDAPAWSPYAESLAYMRIVAPPGEVAYTLLEVHDLESGDERVVFEPEPGLEAAWYVRWAPDGQRLVISLEHYEAADSNIIDGSVVAVLDLSEPDARARPLTEPSMFATYPDWSPNGERIVFTTHDLGFRDFGNYADVKPASNLFTVAPDGTDVRQLTSNEPGESLVRNSTASGDLAGQPTWTPDGERIIFVRATGEAWPGWGMATIEPDGSDMASATGDAYMAGTHPRLRPTP